MDYSILISNPYLAYALFTFGIYRSEKKHLLKSAFHMLQVALLVSLIDTFHPNLTHNLGIDTTISSGGEAFLYFSFVVRLIISLQKGAQRRRSFMQSFTVFLDVTIALVIFTLLGSNSGLFDLQYDILNFFTGEPSDYSPNRLAVIGFWICMFISCMFYGLIYAVVAVPRSIIFDKFNSSTSPGPEEFNLLN